MAARNQRIARLGGCLWWHFYPHETTGDLEAKYRQILRANNKSDALPHPTGSFQVFSL